MIFRIIWVLVFLCLGILFAGVNARNLSDISVLVYTWKDVPVYTGILIAFLVGILWSVPFFFFKTSKRRKKKDQAEPETPGPFSSEETGE